MQLSPRDIPSIDIILRQPDAGLLIAKYSRPLVLEATRAASAALKARLHEGGSKSGELRAGQREKTKAAAAALIISEAGRRLADLFAPRLFPLINATGVVLHTNLGRSPLAPAAIEAISRTAGRYSNLELDLASGERGDRWSHVQELLQRMTGAESALVVNNNAASLYLIVGALAKGKEVIVSRGELIEIGGSFRLPEVLQESGARLVEVGATNRTYLRDYERAITDETALLLKSHWSNFHMEGFVNTVSTKELAALGKERGIPTCEDLGSGLLADLTPWGLPPEPTVQSVTASRIDLVCFSGDKLLGGPQAGIILGGKPIIQRLASHPVTRALRPDKLTMAALEATLRLYLKPETLMDELPILRMLTRTRKSLRAAARRLAARLEGVLSGLADIEIEETWAPVGGGSLPSGKLLSVAVKVTPSNMHEDDLAAALRGGRPPVIARTAEGAVLLDMRTLLDGDFEGLARALSAALRGTEE
jgi:L-seryl-tRNA(Ser) seleniumtransferase